MTLGHISELHGLPVFVFPLLGERCPTMAARLTMTSAPETAARTTDSSRTSAWTSSKDGFAGTGNRPFTPKSSESSTSTR